MRLRIFHVYTQVCVLGPVEMPVNKFYINFVVFFFVVIMHVDDWYNS